jgi:small-conductance mechanosensitive channel
VIAAPTEPIVDGSTFSRPLLVVAIVVGTFVVTRITGLIVRWTVRRVAKRSLVRPTKMWRTRSHRVTGETPETWEHRRRQRIDAAASMLNHLISFVIWIIATIVIFHVLEVDAAVVLSSAGFLGAGLAIGGQHRVNDYLTGLLVHFEDRYGVGDEVVAEVGWAEPVHAVVDHVGLFSTRLRDGTSTLHFPNASLAQIRNLSQEAAAATFRLHVGSQSSDEVADTLRRLAGSSDLTDVVFVGDIESHRPSTGEVEVDVKTLRPLDRRATERLVQRAEAELRRED